MYNTKVICSYNTSDVFLETDMITDKDKEFIRDVLYRQELMDIFGLESEFTELEMENAINELYQNIQNCISLKEPMIKLSRKYMKEDPIFGLMLLFSYDYMYLTHLCISEYLEKGDITKEKMDNLNFHI